MENKLLFGEPIIILESNKVKELMDFEEQFNKELDDLL